MRATAVLALLAGAAFAQGEWVEIRCGKAEELARSADFNGAAAIYGDALARAHKEDLPLAEQEIARSLRKSMEPLWEWKAGPDGTGGGGLRQVLHTVMGKLDPERSGAFVSAHLLAHQLLLRATRAGDTRHVADAAAVVERHVEDGEDVGKCAKVMRDYARGLAARAMGDDRRAAEELEDALDGMADEGWCALAMHAGTELAAARLRMGDEKDARKAVQRIASTYPAASGDISLMWMWQELVKARLKDAPAKVLEPFREAVLAHEARGAVQPVAGRGQRGASGGREASSLLGRSLPRYSRKKPLATAARESDVFELRTGFDKRFKEDQGFLHGVRYRSREGFHWAFWGYAAGLEKLDTTGTESEPDPSEWPSPWQPLYHLAKDETWGVTKRGVVRIED